MPNKPADPPAAAVAETLQTRIPWPVAAWKFEQGPPARLLLLDSTRQHFLNDSMLLVYQLCDGLRSIGQIEQHLQALYPDAKEQISEDLKNALDTLTELGAVNLNERRRDSLIPSATPRSETRRALAIGMATYDDYSGVYFTLQAIRLYHPEILADCEFLVVDNHPDGDAAADLKALEQVIPNYRYLPYTEVSGTSSRNRIFAEANAEAVLCVDSHVLFTPGSLARLMEYFKRNPDSADLLQGVVLHDDGNRVFAHCTPEWRNGIYGYWSTHPQAENAEAEPFEIELQGLGCFACRTENWLGINPRFRGFGGEEGYLHEKYRRNGRQVLCLPFLRYQHRFAPAGKPYPVLWADRIRNHMIGYAELGLKADAMKTHLDQLLGTPFTGQHYIRVNAEIESPLFAAEVIYATVSEQRSLYAQHLNLQLQHLKINERTRLISYREASDPPAEQRRTLRHALEVMQDERLEHVLVLQDGIAFSDAFEAHFARMLELLEEHPTWRLVRLDGTLDDPVKEPVLDPRTQDNLGGVYWLNARALPLLKRLPEDGKLPKSLRFGKAQMLHFRPGLCQLVA